MNQVPKASQCIVTGVLGPAQAGVWEGQTDHVLEVSRRGEVEQPVLTGRMGSRAGPRLDICGGVWVVQET